MSANDHELEPRELATRLEAGWQVVDVRTPEEREAGHIAGTRHIELDQLSQAAATLDQGRPVAFYCRSGARSGMATQAFLASGWDAYNLAGGLLAWVAAGLPLEPAEGSVADH